MDSEQFVVRVYGCVIILGFCSFTDVVKRSRGSVQYFALSNAQYFVISYSCVLIENT